MLRKSHVGVMGMGKTKAKKESTPVVGVTSTATMMRKVIQPLKSGDITTQARKDKLLRILDKTSDNFLQGLDSGRVQVSEVKDIDTIARLVLVLSGEAEKIKAKAETSETQAITLPKQSVLSKDDPSVQDIFNKLFTTYNENNDKVE